MNKRGEENNGRRMEGRDPDRQAGGPGYGAQSGAVRCGGQAQDQSCVPSLCLGPLSMEIAHNMNHL